MKWFLVLALAGLALSGCDKAKNLMTSDLSIVKDGTLEFDKSLTIGQAIDKYKYFKGTKWEAITSDNGRRIVNVVGDIDISRYPLLNSDNTPGLKSAYIKFSFVINQDKTFDVKWCGVGTEKKDGTKVEPADNILLQRCRITLKEIYDNMPKEVTATDKAAAIDAEGCYELKELAGRAESVMRYEMGMHNKYPDSVPREHYPDYITIKRIDDTSDTQNYKLMAISSKCSKAYIASSEEHEVREINKP